MENISKTTGILFRNGQFTSSGVLYVWKRTGYIITAGHVLYGNAFDTDPVLSDWTVRDHQGNIHQVIELYGDRLFARENDLVQLRLTPDSDLTCLGCPIFTEVPASASQEYFFRGQYESINTPVNKGPVRYDERVSGSAYKFLCATAKEQLQDSDFNFGGEWLSGCSGSGLFLSERQDAICSGILLAIPNRGADGKLLFSGINALKKIGFGPEIVPAMVFEPNPDYLTPEWFKIKLDNAIAALGNRYSPTINFQLPIAKVFNGISRNETFQGDLDAVFSAVFEEKRRVYHADDVPEIKTDMAQGNALLEAFKKDYLSHPLKGKEPILLLEWTEQINAIASIYYSCRSRLFDLQRARVRVQTQPNYSIQPYETEIHEVTSVLNALAEFTSHLSSPECKIANDPFVIVRGDAGYGKSHLLADIARQREKQGHHTIMLLGHQFQTAENPWQQLLSRLMRGGDADGFLGELNARGAIDGNRVLLIIDAINEGTGRAVWRDHLVEFLLTIKKHPWVGLVLSIRSSYEPLLLPDQIRKNKLACFVTHEGFADAEEDATDYFFDNYAITRPGIPLLHPEFANPLFLKLFCDGLHRKNLHSVPAGIEGISMVLELFLDGINEKLSVRYGYHPRQRLVQHFVEALAEEIAKTDKKYITYDAAVALALRSTTLNDLTQRSAFWEGLIDEGLVQKELYWLDSNQSEEGYIIAYERFHEHLLVSSLLKRVKNPFSSVKKGRTLHPYVGNESACRENEGMVEALSIQLPEKFGVELFDVCKGMRGSRSLAQGFVKSLIWRTNTSYNPLKARQKSENVWCWLQRRLLDKIQGERKPRIDKYLKEVVLGENELDEPLLRHLLLISGNKGNPYNADYLHQRFRGMSLPVRDTSLLPWLAEEYSRGMTVKRLIRWAWKQEPMAHLTDDSILLSCTTLAWFLISSNRKLRDQTTKALVCLLYERERLIQPLLRKFEGVNDPYIYERLLAVAYGCTLRARGHGFLHQLCEYLLQNFFGQVNVYPHILARDYARSICTFALQMTIITPDQYQLARPPYRSQMPPQDLPEEQIKQSFAWQDGVPDGYYLHEIAESMNVTSYGDFGNYVFEPILRFWEVDVANMKLYALSRILDYGYNVAQYGPAERAISELRDGNERIGKKYEYIAMHETLAIVADNCPINADDYDAQQTDRYKGAWQKRIRDIDTSTVLTETLQSTDDPRISRPWWVACTLPDWSKNNTHWMQATDDLPEVPSVLELKEGTEWITLQTSFSWQEDSRPGDDRYNNPHKRLYMYYRPYLVRQEDARAFINHCMAIRPRESDLPDSREYTAVFNREFYWSEPYRDQQMPYYGGEGDHEIYARKTGKFIAKVHIPVEALSWGESLDHSKESTIEIHRLSRLLWEALRLRFVHKDGQYVNERNELVCLDPSVYQKGPGALLINRDVLSGFLKERGLALIWFIEGAKQILGGHNTGTLNDPRMEHNVKGFGCFDGCKLTSHQRSYIKQY